MRLDQPEKLQPASERMVVSGRVPVLTFQTLSSETMVLPSPESAGMAAEAFTMRSEIATRPVLSRHRYTKSKETMATDPSEETPVAAPRAYPPPGRVSIRVPPDWVHR